MIVSHEAGPSLASCITLSIEQTLCFHGCTMLGNLVYSIIFQILVLPFAVAKALVMQYFPVSSKNWTKDVTPSTKRGKGSVERVFRKCASEQEVIWNTWLCVWHQQTCERLLLLKTNCSLMNVIAVYEPLPNLVQCEGELLNPPTFASVICNICIRGTGRSVISSHQDDALSA